MHAPSVPVPVDATSRQLALAAHLAAYSWMVLPLVAPFVLPLVCLAARPDDPFVRHHVMASLNFQIAFAIYGAVAAVLVIVLVGLPILLVLALLGLIFPAYAAWAAADGRSYDYPLTPHFLR